MQRLKLVPSAQVEEMAQLLVAQHRRLRELEINLQKEKQEKANLEMDFQHLLDQLNCVTNIHSMRDDQIVVCG
jgi:hypothetical protein